MRLYAELTISIISGCRLVYLPPYSPDLNPIEEGFSAMKAWIRRNRDFTLRELEGGEGRHPAQMLIRAVCEAMSQRSITGWFRDCSYI
jgi:hypothetical protein